MPQSPLILCVDDNEEGLAIRRLVLEGAGYSVFTAAGGEQALALFADNEIAGVVLDYSMPGMNGGEVAAEMRRLKPQVPIILLSGFVTEIPQKALKLVDVFIPKGSPAAALLQELK